MVWQLVDDGPGGANVNGMMAINGTPHASLYGGFAYWLSALNAGTCPRSSVARNFLQTSEFNSLCRANGFAGGAGSYTLNVSY